MRKAGSKAQATLQLFSPRCGPPGSCARLAEVAERSQGVLWSMARSTSRHPAESRIQEEIESQKRQAPVSRLHLYFLTLSALQDKRACFQGLASLQQEFSQINIYDVYVDFKSPASCLRGHQATAEKLAEASGYHPGLLGPWAAAAGMQLNQYSQEWRVSVCGLASCSLWTGRQPT